MYQGRCTVGVRDGLTRSLYVLVSVCVPSPWNPVLQYPKAMHGGGDETSIAWLGCLARSVEPFPSLPYEMHDGKILTGCYDTTLEE